MANKRYLKKRIQQLCGEAAVEVLINLPQNVSHDIVFKLAQLQSTTISNISFSFDRSHRDFANGREYNKARHTYNKEAFKRLTSDFKEGLSTIVKEINSTLTAEQRAANKEANQK